MPRSRTEVCSRGKDGKKRCHPVGQKKSKISKGKVLQKTTFKDAIKKADRSRRKAALRPVVAKRVNDWLMHVDQALPTQQFSSLRFNNVDEAKRLYGEPDLTIERDIMTNSMKVVGNNMELVTLETDSDYTSSSGGDYSSSSGSSSFD